MQSKEKPDPFDDENGCLKLSQDKKIWKFVHEEDYRYKTKILEGRSCNFNWLKIVPDGIITVKGTFDRGYASDGCTPKYNFLHITWGNFDGKFIKHDKDELNTQHYYRPLTYFASMVHDVLYQYKDVDLIPARKQIKYFIKC